MAEPQRHRWRSVRVRITAVATALTAVTVGLAGWWLVRSVEGTRLGQVRRAINERVVAVVESLEAGEEPAQAIAGEARFGAGFIQVLDPPGDVLAASPGVPSEQPFSFLAIGPNDVVGTSGSLRVDNARGLSMPLELTYRTVDTPAGERTVVVAAPLDEVEQSVAALRRNLVAGVPLLVGVVGLVSWGVVGRALRPVESIRREVEAIGGTTLHRRVPMPATGDEVDRLAHTMNAMLERLEGASTRQRQFVADASHELRSPVAAIRTELEVAMRSGGAADWPGVAASLLAEEHRLERLVDDLLLLASIDDRRPAGLAPVDVRAVVVDEAARARRVPVETDVPDGLTVAGSRPQLSRAIANVVDNAARHARAAVRVSASRRGGRIRVVVDDDGPGIPVSERDRVFERFTRLEEARDRDRGGAGLGLAVVRSVAEAHGGTATAHDSPFGGARLVLELPVA